MRVWLCGFARGICELLCAVVRGVVRGICELLRAGLCAGLCAGLGAGFASWCARGCVRGCVRVMSRDLYSLLRFFMRFCTADKRHLLSFYYNCDYLFTQFLCLCGFARVSVLFYAQRRKNLHARLCRTRRLNCFIALKLSYNNYKFYS